MNEIAASLGVTKAALYHYFAEQEQFAGRVFRARNGCGVCKHGRARKEGRNGRERLVLTMSYYVAQLINELNCRVVLMEDKALEPEDQAKLVRRATL